MSNEWSREGHHNRYARHVEGSSRKKRSELIESQMTSDFIREYLRGYRVWIRCRLGPYYAGQLEQGLADEERKMLGNWRYFADVVAVGAKDIILGEFAIHFGSDHVGKIIGYAYLLAMTPEFTQFHDRELRLIGVSPQFDPLAQIMCDRFDIEMIGFKPLYVEAYLDKLELRKRRPTLSLLPSIARIGEKYAQGYRV